MSTMTGSPGVAQGLLTRLTHLSFSGGKISPEEANEVNQLLQQLREQGAAAIPAIREYLQQNQDFSFDDFAGGNLVNYGTLRLGLLDALQQIGGAEAIQLSAATLQQTAEPLEIALLSSYLESQQPGQFRQLELTAAQEALAQAANGQVPGRDLSPLFELLQAYGGTNIVPDLEKAVAQWNYYATLALAGLPDGAGIPTLIKLAQDPAVSSLGSGDFALRPLAQAALQYPAAAAALVDDARQNRVPDKAWPTIAGALSGSYIQYGNQIFGSTAPAQNWSPEQVSQRIALINQMLAATTSPAGRQALQSALTSVTARLPR
jgi:hypothetical protein